MLSMGLQRVRHNLTTEQQKHRCAQCTDLHTVIWALTYMNFLSQAKAKYENHPNVHQQVNG